MKKNCFKPPMSKVKLKKKGIEKNEKNEKVSNLQ